MAYTRKVYGSLTVLKDLTVNGDFEFGNATTDTLTVNGLLKLDAGGGADAANAVLMGVGTSANPSTSSTANDKFVELRCKTTATSGDNRLMYLRYDQAGAAGGGECIRAFTKATAALGTARGAQISLDLSAAGSVTGLGVGLDGQLMIADALPAGGTYFAGQSEMYFAASSSIAAVTTHAIHSFIANGDATALATCLNVFAIKGGEGTGEMVYNNNSTGATESNGSIRILVDEGSGYVARYLRYWDAENS